MVFEQDGVVILPGNANDPESLVQAAARLLGSSLRELFPIRPTVSDESGPLALHSDGAYVVTDVHGRTAAIRHPDEDYLFMLSSQHASEGGQTFLIDGYTFIDRLAVEDAELYESVTTVDVDFFGAWTAPPRGVPTTPRICPLVEYTRRGRRVVRAGDYASPAPREPLRSVHDELLDRYIDVLAAQASAAPRTLLESGDILAVDNYRFLHGRDGFTGRRALHVMTALSTGAFY
ncbi:TauD/TfdA family dioxygenase [Rhodococcoides kyotonense]|uniref:TauD/TfdA family dioxygenase n=1 Tax=Rhodococcoides kyotonense TaxID=398843 RepID=UPI0015955A4F|nr:TauD/TfdA family dioxygenase [Rhodococcus kyotonensis]